MTNADTNSRSGVAIFGGGCFWCMQPPFDAEPGVIATEVGYMGGAMPDPTYRDVSTGRTGHVEVIRVIYDPEQVDYMRLLEIFWENIDPTQADGQFADRGSQYRTVIFCNSTQQREQAEFSKRALEESGRYDAPVATAIEEASPFWPAENDHQCYYRKAPDHYNRYKEGSGRAAFIRRNRQH